MKKIHMAVGLVLGLLPCTGNAFIYAVIVLKKWDPVCKQDHVFIGFSDYHDKTSDANKIQVAAIERMFASLDKSKVKILLEDLSSPGCGGRCSCGKFMVNSRGGLLGGLTVSCRQNGFDVDNLEYRYCRVSALGPVLNNVTHHPHEFPSVVATSVDALAQEITTITKEINTYNDGAILAECYRQGLQEVASQLQEWQQPRYAQLSVANYVKDYCTQEDRLEFVKNLLTFDSGLLDLKLAHAVVNTHDKNKVIAITGGAHITRVVEMLSSVGYEQVYATNVQFTKEYDLKKCVGSTVVDGQYCVRPEPIEFEEVKKYLL